ncbi:MAG TPA: MlaD family protein [Longimicrobiales bacterium]|nr:MlaD family protein [Longimicrobiales bacterium]
MAEQTRQTRRILFGTLIMLGLFGGAILIFFMDDLLGAFEREYVIHVILPGATGLAPESPVWVSGRHVGRITAVGLLPAGGDTLARVVIDVELPVDVQRHVRTDSEVRLTSIGPISERVIDISTGSAAAPVLPPGDTLWQTPQVTPFQLTARAAVVRADLTAVLADLREQAPAIRARLEQTERAFTRMQAMMTEARQLQVDLNANPGFRLLQSPSFAAAMEGTRSHAEELPAMIERLRATSGPPAEVRAALARLQLRADSLRSDLAAASALLNNPNGTLSRMQQDTAITRALNAARAELDSLIVDMRSNPLRYVF